jgi:ribose-phosphate pyrophosphokinase
MAGCVIGAVHAAALLREKGASKVYVVATHGLLSGTAPEDFAACEHIERVVVTNSIPQEDHMRRCPKLRQMDCGGIVAEAIRRVHFQESLFSMYSPPWPELSPSRRRPGTATSRSRTVSSCDPTASS